MEKLKTTQLWAASLTLTPPSDTVISAGFQDGEADPDLFNWIFQTHGKAILQAQADIAQIGEDATEEHAGYEQRLDSIDQSLNSVDQALNSQGQEINALEEATTENARGATRSVAGLLEVADTTEALEGQRDNLAITPLSLRSALLNYGTLTSLFRGFWEQRQPDVFTDPGDNVLMVHTVPDNFPLSAFWVAVVEDTEQDEFYNVIFMPVFIELLTGAGDPRYMQKATKFEAYVWVCDEAQLYVRVTRASRQVRCQVVTEDRQFGQPQTNKFKIRQLGIKQLYNDNTDAASE